MRWCCGGGSGSSSISSGNVKNHQSKLMEDTSTAVTPSTLMTELNFKTGKNLTKIFKVCEVKGGNKSKKSSYSYSNKKNCVLQEHDNIQLSSNESVDVSNSTRRGVLKSNLKLLQPQNTIKLSSQHVTKGVQYADKVCFCGETIYFNAGERGIKEKIKLLQNEDNNMAGKTLSRRGNEDETHYCNNKLLRSKNQPQVSSNDEYNVKEKKNLCDSLLYNEQSPTKQFNFSSETSSMYKHNNNFYYQYHNNHQQQSNQTFDKYGPMLLRTCKTAIYFCSHVSSTIVLQSITTTLPSNSISTHASTLSNYCNIAMLDELQKTGWTIFVADYTKAVEEIQTRRPVLILIDEMIDRFLTFMNSLKKLAENEDVLISPFFKSFPTEEQLQTLLGTSTNFQQFFLHSNVDMSLCEMFARTASRLRAIPALFALIEEAEQPIKICDENNIAQYVNHAYELVTGKARADVLGLNGLKLREISIDNCFAAPNTVTTISSCKNAEFQNAAIVATTSNNSIVEVSPIVENVLKITPTVEGEKSILMPTPFIAATSGCRRFNEWHCMTVPSCSTKSPQFVYVKRGNTDAIGCDLSLKNLCSQNALVETPITETLNIFDSVVAPCEDEEMQMQVRDGLKVLPSTELYAPTINCFRDNDCITSGYYDGLIRLHHPSKQRKRSVVDAFRENQQRRVSSGSSHSGVSLNDGCGATRRRISTDVVNALENENSWHFDVIELERITEHRPLSQLGVKIFERWNVTETLCCSIDNIARWLQIIEANYQNGNAYHNATHAADVLQATSFFLNSDAVGQYIQDQHAVSALIAATVHDLDHPGRGNAFLMNTRARLAVLYNDHSVLENHHVALAFQLTLSQPGVNIFARIPSDEFSQIRQATIDMVLATDMSRHFEYLTKFQQILGILPDSEENRDANSLSICRMMIKCADIANPTREWKLCYQWAMRIVVEYFDQTAEEMEKGLPLTMKGFDRETCNIPLTQCTFIDMFAREAFTSWCDFAALPYLLTQLEVNYKKWRGQAADWDSKQNVTMLQKRQGGLW